MALATTTTITADAAAASTAKECSGPPNPQPPPPLQCLSETETESQTQSQSGMPSPCLGERMPCGRLKTKHDAGWRHVVRNFTPSWFAVNMGTGIVSVLLHNLPWNGAWLQYVSYVFFAANVGLFVVFLAISLLRYTLYPEIWRAMISHPGQSLFLGCFPMGFATIINMMIFCCRPWGDWVVHLAWAFWWIDALLSMATCITMPFIVMHRHKPGLHNTTAALLLPIVPTVVAAATGGIVAEALPDPSHALATLVACYVLWGIGQTLSGCVLALYFHRLTVHSLPPREVIVSVFLPIGPLGQGGFGIQQLGKVALAVLPQTAVFRGVGADVDVARAAEILYVLGVFLGLVMWGFALVWTSFAFISIATIKDFPFNMGWWGFTFPLGVWATCTSLLAVNLDSDFFKVSTMIISLAVVALWFMVAARTLHLVVTGDMFFAPCLQDIREKEQAAGGDRRV
ncbi:Plasma membrane sulfite pump involved in sulfite metabolism [Purpureocillium takamizusanense]|uniref:Sulfite efflux pump SSU1 n=1 Tax=Purpureocillium takamizusanense TaxID=2060973 RepID=A0A9Q8VEF0_9HYPO|nr:Plasma membrane sulfite pump involved in sulfite metabolism [Purpureocillium takamizusanense]UNI21829.1 Plasma membrane sulfite pump involved in sulfite metabolism [Purpureocillium takamizusanense]